MPLPVIVLISYFFILQRQKAGYEYMENTGQGQKEKPLRPGRPAPGEK
jgi:hypothetical protein